MLIKNIRKMSKFYGWIDQMFIEDLSTKIYRNNMKMLAKLGEDTFNKLYEDTFTKLYKDSLNRFRSIPQIEHKYQLKLKLKPLIILVYDESTYYFDYANLEDNQRLKQIPARISNNYPKYKNMNIKSKLEYMTHRAMERFLMVNKLGLLCIIYQQLTSIDLRIRREAFTHYKNIFDQYHHTDQQKRNIKFVVTQLRSYNIKNTFFRIYVESRLKFNTGDYDLYIIFLLILMSRECIIVSGILKYI